MNIMASVMTVSYTYSTRINPTHARVFRVNFPFPTVVVVAMLHAEFHEPTSQKPSPRFSIFGVYEVPTGVFDAFRVSAADGRFEYDAAY